MKREFLKTLLPDITDANLDAIMAEVGKDVQAKNGQIATLTTERDGLKAQLDAANASIKSYTDMDIEGIKKAAADWETKYNTDTQALKDQIAAEKYAAIVRDEVSKIRFSSESAKKAFIADLTAKKLPESGGTLLGLSDFETKYREADPGAFAPEDDGNTPMASKGTGGGQPAIGADSMLRAAFGLASNDKK